MHSRHNVIAPMHCLLHFAQAVKVKRSVEANALDPPQTFWVYLQNLMSEKATIEWSKVFGSWDDDTHWTRAVPKDQHDETRRQLLDVVGMEGKQWKEYRSTIVDYRNQIVAHHDLEANIAKYPHYDAALKAAYFIYGRLHGLVHHDSRGGLPESLEQWSNTVAGNMTAIIRNAFAGSAPMGSNMKKKG
jgi:hypothetical protein